MAMSRNTPAHTSREPAPVAETRTALAGGKKGFAITGVLSLFLSEVVILALAWGTCKGNGLRRCRGAGRLERLAARGWEHPHIGCWQNIDAAPGKLQCVVTCGHAKS